MNLLINAGQIIISNWLPARSNVLVDSPSGVVGRHVLDSGTYQISDATVLKIGSEVPRRARVYLLESRGKRLIAATTSDDQGRYAFRWIANRAYDLIAEDIAGTYRSVIANNVMPTPMP